MMISRLHGINSRFGLLISGLAVLCLGWSQPAESKCECEKKMAAILEEDFSFYTDASGEMEFDFDVDKKRQHVEVALLGQDFDSEDKDWAKRDKGAFSDYINAIGVTVSTEMEKPMVRLHVIGQDGQELLTYRYE